MLFLRAAACSRILPSSGWPLSRSLPLIRLGLLAGAAYGLYSAVIEPDLAYYVHGYLESQYRSQGVLFRVVICLLPAVAFLFNRRLFQLSADF